MIWTKIMCSAPFLQFGNELQKQAELLSNYKKNAERAATERAIGYMYSSQPASSCKEHCKLMKEHNTEGRLAPLSSQEKSALKEKSPTWQQQVEMPLLPKTNALLKNTLVGCMMHMKNRCNIY